jgi:hypothetical protein
MLRSILFASVALTCTASLSLASLVTHEPFNYAPGTPLDVNAGGTGQNGGSGWGEGWDVQNNTTTYQASDAAPLTHTNLVSSPGYAIGGGSFTNSGRRIATGFGSAWDAAGAVSDPFGASATAWRRGNIDQGTVWASFLFRKTTINNGRVAFHTNNIPWNHDDGGNADLWVGRIDDNNLRIRTRTLGTVNANQVIAPLTFNETYFVVLAFDLTGDVVDVYLDPAPGSNAPAAPTLDNVALGANFGFKSVAFYPGSGADNGAVDEIRIGTSFADVAPAIPEPATLGLLAGGALLALRRR